MTGAVILAAGGSIRLGQPKQFLVYRGRSLIQRAVDAAAECSPVVVVAGREWERVQQELQAREVCVVQNAEWEHGIGSSIRAGVERALEIAPGVEALVILVCDQPFVTPEVVTALRVSREKGGKRGAACSYGGSLGVPAIFARSLFAELLSLRDDCGAKQIISKLGDDVGRVEFAAGAVDIDTGEDSEILNRSGQVGSVMDET